MSDPKRLLDQGGDDLAMSLLRAGRDLDAEQARARRIALLGAAGASAGAAGGAAGARLAGWSVGAKWMAVGLAAIIIGGVAARSWMRPAAAPPSPQTAGKRIKGDVGSGARAMAPLLRSNTPVALPQGNKCAKGIARRGFLHRLSRVRSATGERQGVCLLHTQAPAGHPASRLLHQGCPSSIALLLQP